MDRFWNKVDVGHPLGCWVWTAWKDDGYGRIDVDGRGVMAHRWSYQALVGPIPEGMQLDHLCRVRSCVNPDHLELVTSAENTRRGFSVSRANRAKTHCPSGHVYDEVNTYIDRRGKRYCRKCQNKRRSERRKRARAVPRR